MGFLPVTNTTHDPDTEKSKPPPPPSQRQWHLLGHLLGQDSGMSGPFPSRMENNSDSRQTFLPDMHWQGPDLGKIISPKPQVNRMTFQMETLDLEQSGWLSP